MGFNFFSEENAKRVGRAVSLLTVAVFVLLMVFPAIDMVFTIDRTSRQTENRTLAAFPAFPADAESLVTYPASLEAYLNDNFGFRKRLVKFYNRFNLVCFGKAGKEVNAVKGKEGWYFYTGEGLVDYHQGTIPLTDKEIAKWIDAISARKRHAESVGARYLLVFAPNSSTIYPQYLPDWMANVTGRETRLDQLVRAIAKETDVQFLDLRPALREAAKHERVFNRTDTHWNDLGAFAGTNALLERLTIWYPGVSPLSRVDFDLTVQKRPAGDIVTMLGSGDQETEEWLSLAYKKPPSVSMEETKEFPGIKTNVGRHYRVKCASSPAGGPQKAVVFRDSFTTAMIPYLSSRLPDALYLWTHRYYPDLVEKEKPDLVLEIMVERILGSSAPENLKYDESGK